MSMVGTSTVVGRNSARRITLGALLLCTSLCFAQDDDGEVFMVPMRDGVRLRTTVYFPEGAGPWPVVLERSQLEAEEQQFRTFEEYYRTGVAWAVQNTRGRYGSEGDPVPVYDTDGWGALQDGYDTCAWLVAQDWCNGKVGTIGGSARGGYAHLLSAVNAPGLEAVFVRDGLANLWESILFTDGAWRYADSAWYRGNGDINRLFNHPAFDETWAPFDTTRRSNYRDHAITYEVGWFDAFRQGSMHSWRDLQHYGTARARRLSKLALEARGHINIDTWLANQPWPAEATVPPTAYQGRALFDHYLKGIENGYADLPAVTYYLMGNVDTVGNPGIGNAWHAVDTWPPPVRWVPLYLQGDGTLAPNLKHLEPTAQTIVYNPDDPCPTIGGSALWDAMPGMLDQSGIEDRDDVLTFETAPLSAPLEVTGPIRATLFAASDQVDTDFVVKLTDVYPDGRSMVVTDGIVRAASRDSIRDPELMTPGTVYRFDVNVWDIAMLFDVGHRLRLTITSSNYPRYEANPNTGAGPADAHALKRVARNTVHMGLHYPSHVMIPVRQRSDATILWTEVDDDPPTYRVDDVVAYCEEPVTLTVMGENLSTNPYLAFIVHFDPHELTIDTISMGDALPGWTFRYDEYSEDSKIVELIQLDASSARASGAIFEVTATPRRCDQDTWLTLRTTGDAIGYSAHITSLDPARRLPAIALTGAATLSWECGDPFVDPGATATDPQDGDLSDWTTVTGEVDDENPGTYTLTYVATDDDGQQSAEVVRTVNVVDTLAPEITLTGAESVVLACGEAYIDPGATAVDGCDGARNVSNNASVVDTETPGDYTVTYTAVDSAGNVSRRTREVRVEDTLPPVFMGNNLAAVTLACGQAYETTGIWAEDDCDGTLPVSTTGTVPLDTPGTYPVTLRATDAAGNIVTRTRQVTVLDTSPPVLTLVGEASLELACGETFFDPGATALDNCGEDVTVQAEGPFPNPLTVGEHVRTYRATDASGNSATTTRTLHVTDTTPPVVRVAGQFAIGVSCGDAWNDPGATADDNCDGNVSVTTQGTVDLRAPGQYTLTYEAEDAAGNRGTATRTVTVIDNTPPVVTRLGNAQMEVACGEPFDDPGATATDACAGVLAVTRTPETFHTETPGTYAFTYRAEDGAGNNATATRTVTVRECASPEGEGAPVEGEPEGEGEGALTVEDWARRLLARFDDHDMNSDGQLTFEEIVAGEWGFSRDLLTAFDTDGSGALSKTELSAYLSGAPDPAPGCACIDTARKGVQNVLGDLFFALLAFAVLMGLHPLWRMRS